MKMQGIKVDANYEEVVVIPRSDKEYVFKAVSVRNYESFDLLCPAPTAPIRKHKDGREEIMTSDEKYQEEVNNWASKKSAWMVLQSLRGTKDLEWETVKEDDPETWSNYIDELLNAGFNDPEVARIVQAVQNACGFNQEKIDKATQDFLAGVGVA